LLFTPIILYGLYSGYSGQPIYNPWLMNFIDIAFTGLPLVIFGAIDQEYEKEAFIRNPILYEDGQVNYLFSFKVFWYWYLPL
jgi:magnesium-transporting ATPase (P-type)